MHRRFGFVVSLCGVVFVMLPLSTVFRQPEVVTAAVGFMLIIVGTFFAVESVARHKK